jgi:hypothetical protein
MTNKVSAGQAATALEGNVQMFTALMTTTKTKRNGANQTKRTFVVYCSQGETRYGFLMSFSRFGLLLFG